MNEAEITNVVRKVLQQERESRADNYDHDVLKTISTLLTSFGIEEEDRIDIRLDFQHLRKWRKSVEQVERVGWGAVATVIVTGLLGALWLGIKAMLGK